ncbi:signal peptidase [Mycolicibacterium novocastrense]|uniref:Lipoprotein signal peptidase n=1 Tax=Mycolicibacterium novocastrense TaxID=59813 RepID=A0ABQ0KBA8_MYCNV|nr:signal peptidase [Mycolicibacterium novocastrense]
MTTVRALAVRRRSILLAAAAALTVFDLSVKAWAATALSTGPIDWWPVALRLAYNPGAAFSLAADAPRWLLLAVTTVVTAAVAVFAWRTAPTAKLPWRIALAAILGGATANVIDRAPDGVVTDYLHTGWWPTFNLADTFIVGGALTLIVLTVFGHSHHHDQASGVR